MRQSIYCALIILLSGCVQSPQYPPVEKPQQPKSYIQAASIEPGCLLPPPETIDASISGSIKLEVGVSTDGIPLNTKVIKSSGNLSLDRTFQAAAMTCHFNPATSYTPYTDTTIPVVSNYALTQNWPAGHKFIGPFRCFQPDYPIRALRRQEQAKVDVYFRRTTEDGLFEIKTISSVESKEPTQASLTAAEQCLAHKETQTDLLIGEWYIAPTIWRIE
jgi:TonB family protein